MDRRIFVLFVALFALAVLAGCSQVFEAGISGTVVTTTSGGTSDVAVANVNVFAYTDKGLRDSDYTQFVNKTRVRPSEGAGYVATSTTNAQGQFVVNKIVWETKKSEFGKTADVNKLYLIFYHKDYNPQKYDATVISGSTNADNVYITLTGNKDYTTLNINVHDVASGSLMNEACTLEYTIEGRTETLQVGTGTATFSVSFEKGTTPNIKFVLTSPGTRWSMCDNSGAVIPDYTESSIEDGTLRVDLYMKNYEFTLPGFSGDIDGERTLYDDHSHDGSDNVLVWLAYHGTDSKWYPFVDTTKAGVRTYARETTASVNVYLTHGLFSGVGGSRSINVNEDDYPLITNWNDYDGRNLTVELGLFKGEYTGAGDYDGYSFNYTPGVSGSDIGHATMTSKPVQ